MLHFQSTPHNLQPIVRRSRRLLERGLNFLLIAALAFPSWAAAPQRSPAETTAKVVSHRAAASPWQDRPERAVAVPPPDFRWPQAAPTGTPFSTAEPEPLAAFQLFLPFVSTFAEAPQATPEPTSTAIPVESGDPAERPTIILQATTATDSDCSDFFCVFQVTASNEDAGIKPECNNYATTWPEIYMGECPSSGQGITSGFRFANVNIPREAEIAEAYLEFTVDGTYTTLIEVEFAGEASDNAAAFSAGSKPSDRTLTSATVNWEVLSSDSWISGQTRLTPNLATAVQEIVNRPGWTSGQALAIIVKNVESGNNYRRVFAYDRDSAHGARLIIHLLNPLPEDSANSPGGPGGSKNGGSNDNRDCWVSVCDTTQGSAGDPINTRTGGLELNFGDLTVPTSAGALIFERIYNSAVTNTYTATLGYGWTHNHETRLILPGSPGGQVGRIWFKAHGTNQYRFDIITGTTTTYQPYSGIAATLIYTNSIYTLTNALQQVYVFDDSGHLLAWSDENGHQFTYTYSNGLLERVEDDSGQRYLELEYDNEDRIRGVSDHEGRSVSYGYDIATGDLISSTDVLNHTWTHIYSDTTHLLWKVIDPGGLTVVHTDFDDQGRAFRQYDGLGNLVLEIQYPMTGSTVITNALGITQTHIYDARNTLVGQAGPLDTTRQTTYDDNFRVATLTDALSRTTTMTWSSSGANLTYSQDAAGHAVNLAYDGLNNLTQLVDARGFTTTYTYSDTLRTAAIDALGNATLYTYTTAGDAPQPVGRLKAVTDPRGNTTTYTYNEFGQRLSSTDALERTTTFAYDDLGRLQTATDSGGRDNWTCYDQAGRVIRTVQNASGDGSTPETDPCDAINYEPSEDPAYDRINETVYDDSGNVIASMDSAGRVTRTYYDANRRPITVTQNLTGWSPTNPNPPDYDPAFPDENVSTSTIYDDQGNVIATIDVFGRVTRTYYDELNRPVTVTQNLVGVAIDNPNPPAFDPDHPDQNVSTTTIYDVVGNAIAAIDALGRITRTYFDLLDRPITITQNLVGAAITDPAPPAFNPAFPDQNVSTVSTYDENGNAIATVDPLGRVTRTWYDALNRPMTTTQNLIGSLFVAQPPAYDPDFPDRNVSMAFRYDDAGDLIATLDQLGRVTRTYYDALNRPVTVTQNLVNWTVADPNPPEFDPEHPDWNVSTSTLYEPDTGRAIAQIDPLGKITRTYYDDLGRVVTVTQNLVGDVWASAPPAFDPDFPDRNLSTHTVYDADGYAIARIDPLGRITRTYFDVLGRAVTVTQNLVGAAISDPAPPAFDPESPDENVSSSTLYDGSGLAIATMDPLGRITRIYYDGLYRPVTMTLNLVGAAITDPAPPAFDPAYPDRNISTVTRYDAAGQAVIQVNALGGVTTVDYDGLGRQVSIIDPLSHTTQHGYDGAGNRIALTDAEGIITRYEYDDLGRLVAVVENYRVGFSPDVETNVRTEYGYDALGNRLTLTNGNAHVTTFAYDGLGRLVSETDPLTHTTTYTYNAAGLRVGLLDANGASTTFAYDGAYRLVGIDYPTGTADVSFAYDALGRRQVMTDGVGVTRWAYDGLSRPISVTDPFTGTVLYGYDGLGNRTHLGYPDGEVVTYTFDAVNRLVAVETDGWAPGPVSYAYNALGQPLTISVPNSLTTVYGYDAAHRLVTITHNSETELLAEYAYALDATGNRTGVTERVRPPETPPPTPTNTPTPVTPTPTPTPKPPTFIERVSVDSQGEEGNDDSWDAVLSGDGRYVLFISAADNLVISDTNGYDDVFLRDRLGDLTIRINLGPGGAEADQYSDHPALSAGGDYATFRSLAGNLVSPDTSWDNVFLRTIVSGTNEMLDVSSLGAQDNCNADFATVSADGRYAVFQSCADNLVPDVNGDQIYLRDRDTDETFVVSVNDEEEPGDWASLRPMISADGDWIVYVSFAENLVADDTNGEPDIFVYDRVEALVERVNVSSNEDEANGWSAAPALSADGRYVVFASNANNLVAGDTNGVPDIFVRDRQTGTTTRVSRSSVGTQANGTSYSPAISGDGRYVAFVSEANNLVPDDTNGVTDIFVHDRQTGLTHRVSVRADGTQGNSYSGVPALSADGRFVAFVSAANNLVADDENLSSDIFVVDLHVHATNATPTPTPAVGTGSGLRGDYFDNLDLDGPPVVTRLDAQVDFGWGEGTPAPGVGANEFSVRWTGEVQPKFSEAYTFRTLSDDGVRLWVDDELVIDDWEAHAPEWNSSDPIALVAGEKYNLVLEYFEDGGGAEVHLYWSAYSQAEEVIATSQLYPAAIPTATPTPTLTPSPTPLPDLIFADSFESGDLSAWSGSSTNGGNLSVTAGAALSQTYGLNVFINNNTAMYVEDSSPNSETRYRARFRFDPNSIPMGSGNAHHIFYGYSGASTLVLRMELRCNGGGCPSGGGSYQVRAELRNNSSTWTSTSWFTLSDAPHSLEFDWQASASGSLTLWIDGSQQANVTGVNNSNRRIDLVRWGPVNGIDNGTRGTYYLDDFDSRRYNYIGGRQLGGGVLAAHRPALTATASSPATRPTATRWPTATEAAAPSARRLSKPGYLSINSARPASSLLASNGELVVTVITYTYDALYRLTGADYASTDLALDGAYFHYTYDAVGNRLAQEVMGGMALTYTYDIANRLVAVGVIPYTWDDNGNLLDDGTSEYAYDAANRLVGVTQGEDEYAFAYSGLGDRLMQTVNSVPTYYSLDLAAGLTQVLADGTYTYLYGNGRIAQDDGADFDYFLGDALGSVRQLADETGDVTLLRRYEPYGDVLESVGTGETSYDFTGEWRDVTGLVFLRARYYSTMEGRFTTRDLWPGTGFSPQTLNRWGYAEGDPVNRVDPSGFSPRLGIADDCWLQMPILDPLTGIVTWICAMPNPPITLPKLDQAPKELCEVQRRRDCPPCPPPEFQIHRVPPGKRHWPCSGDHYHIIVYRQNPRTCECFAKRVFGGCLEQGGYPPGYRASFRR